MFSYLTESKSKKPIWDYSDLRSAIQERRKGNKYFNQTDSNIPVNYKYILEEKDTQKKSSQWRSRLGSYSSLQT